MFLVFWIPFATFCIGLLVVNKKAPANVKTILFLILGLITVFALLF